MALAGRTALITGASSGLGAHFARLFAREGANVIVGARRIAKVEQLVEELQGNGHRALAVGSGALSPMRRSRRVMHKRARSGQSGMISMR